MQPRRHSVCSSGTQTRPNISVKATGGDKHSDVRTSLSVASEADVAAYPAIYSAIAKSGSVPPWKFDDQVSEAKHIAMTPAVEEALTAALKQDFWNFYIRGAKQAGKLTSSPKTGAEVIEGWRSKPTGKHYEFQCDFVAFINPDAPPTATAK